MYSSQTLTTPRRASSLAFTRVDVLVGIALVVVMLIGGYFRFVGQNWDDFTHLHPDERFLTGVTASLGRGLNFTDSDPAVRQEHYNRCLERYPDNGGMGGFFDADCSPLNPHNAGAGDFVYGTLPLFLVNWASDAYASLQGDTTWSSYEGNHLVGRTLSALAEMSTILIVFFIGVKLHGRWTGLLASFLYACAVLSIQLAHFWTVDAMGNLFVALSIYLAVRVQEDGHLADYLLFGLALAAALASRINSAPLAGLLILAAGYRMLPALDTRLARGERDSLMGHNFVGLVLAGIVTVIGFRLFNPYAFMGPGLFGLTLNPRWLEDLGTARYLVSGMAESPPNWQWAGRTPYLFSFSNMVLWGMGIALGLTSWLSWLWAGYRLLRGKPGATRNLLPFVWILIYFVWLGANWVASMRYFIVLYPMFALMAAWGLTELWNIAQQKRSLVRRLLSFALTAFVVLFTLVWALMFTNIYRHQLTRVQASHWVWENVSGDFSMRIDGTGEEVPLINIGIPNTGGAVGPKLATEASYYAEGQSYEITFTPAATGTISTITAPHLGDPLNDPDDESLLIRIYAPGVTDQGLDTMLSQAQLTGNLANTAHQIGAGYTLALDPPFVVQEGVTYTMVVQAVSGPLMGSGSIVSHEGSWDDPIPWKICAMPPGITLADDPPSGLSTANSCNGRDAWGALLNGFGLELIYEDVPQKRDLLQQALDNSDYLTVSSNRFYDSISRIPVRWPMTLRYYETLFNGELGFELVATFQETFELGPLRVSDQYLPTYTGPGWLNEFEAEEAFHVYDHPVVYIFRKTNRYSSENTAGILNSVSLNRADVASGSFNDPTLLGADPVYSLPASKAPTYLQLPRDLREMQYSGGTWSDRFDTTSLVNTSPVMTLILWWLTIVMFGLMGWPLLFALFPGLADRGYGFAKLAGITLTAWLAWMLASARIPVWWQGGLAVMALIVAGFSLWMGWRVRAQLFAYLREYWRRLLWIEVLTLAAFVVFLGVRMSNPDLWHTYFGGEKPMDFAYFNAVLRSTAFPPLDPWYAEGYINYYYFGFVIVGTPTLLLGVVPSVAYNLAIPTLFALTGIGAFSVAFNIVAAFQARALKESEDTAARSFTRPASPWAAGIAALLMCVVLGNLDTLRVFGTGLAQLGGYSRPTGLEQYLVEQYTSENGVMPSGDALLDIASRAADPQIGDRLGYEIDESISLVTSLGKGIAAVMGGQPLQIAANRWYWGPTRVLGETPGVEGNAINEMPFFTFLYGDLHAHMISMPLMLLVLGFLLNEFVLAGSDERRGLTRVIAVMFGALIVGLLRPTNSWDWITFFLFGIVGLLAAWWVRWRVLNRRTLLDAGSRIGLFVIASFALTLPFLTWYASTYSRVLPWTGGRTPLWAYFDIHGVFLFLLFSLFVWDTGRWFRGIYLRSLRGTWPVLMLALAATALVVIGLFFLAAASYQVVLVAVPMLIWAVVLFFRPGQARAMQFLLACAGLALALTLGVEFVVLDGDIGRQNTVFKFYIQAWLLFSVTAGAAFAWLIESSVNWSSRLRNPWLVIGSILLAVAALYPLMATRGRSMDRMSMDVPLTLDGMEYMRYANHTEITTSFKLEEDYEIIRWLQENISGTPIVMEGQAAREYLWGGRISIYTGLPSVIGWNWHQRQQRTFDPMPRIVQQRVANVNAFYTLSDTLVAWNIIQHYDVGYIVVGPLERAYYPIEGLAKFERMVENGQLEVVYREGANSIYRVIKDENFQRGEPL